MKFFHKKFTQSDLQNLKLEIKSIWESPTIDGVFFKKLETKVDGRGDLTELWSKPWVREGKVEPEIRHIYFNTTHEGSIKGWHVHEKTISQYTCVVGKMQVVLIDGRAASKTYGHVNQFIIGEKNPSFIRIPPGVLKAWKSLKGDSVIVNLLTSEDMRDNFRYTWNLVLENIWEPRNG